MAKITKIFKAKKKENMKVMIGTPSMDGRLDVRYVDSLTRTIELGKTLGIDVLPLYICYDALIQKARNDIMDIAVKSGVDVLVFIDSDESWKPEDFFKLLSYKEDIVGGTARRKSDEESYVCKALTFPIERDKKTGLIECAGISTGFTKITKKAMTEIYSCSQPYKDRDQEKRMVFEVVVSDGELVSEDITMCDKFRAMGYKIWLDPEIVCDHVGIKVYSGNFLEWLNKITPKEKR